MSEQSAELNRREAVARVAFSLTAFGATSLMPTPLRPEEASLVHHAVAALQTEEPYQPRAFQGHEWRLLRDLAERILPADDRSGSALDAGAPEFIDLLASNNEELLRVLTSGMLWLQHEMKKRYGADFFGAAEEQRVEMLDLLVANVAPPDPGYSSYVDSVEYQGFQEYTLEAPNGLLPGIRFFGWVRRLVVDAFYTSPEGIRDVDYRGNRFERAYTVPASSLRYALRRSPFAEE